MLLGPGLRALRRMRVPFAAAVVFAGLWLLGAIAPAPALAGFALIAAAALVENGRREAAPGNDREKARAAAGNDPGGLQAVLSGLPFPVIALSRREEVIALNGEASAIAPALRRGQSVLLGLRAPKAQSVAGGGLRARSGRALVRSHGRSDILAGQDVCRRPGAAHVPGPHAIAAGGGHARRLRGQCQP